MTTKDFVIDSNDDNFSNNSENVADFTTNSFAIDSYNDNFSNNSENFTEFTTKNFDIDANDDEIWNNSEKIANFHTKYVDSNNDNFSNNSETITESKSNDIDLNILDIIIKSSSVDFDDSGPDEKGRLYFKLKTNYKNERPQEKEAKDVKQCRKLVGYILKMGPLDAGRVVMREAKELLQKVVVAGEKLPVDIYNTTTEWVALAAHLHKLSAEKSDWLMTCHYEAELKSNFGKRMWYCVLAPTLRGEFDSPFGATDCRVLYKAANVVPKRFEIADKYLNNVANYMKNPCTKLIPQPHNWLDILLGTVSKQEQCYPNSNKTKKFDERVSIKKQHRTPHHMDAGSRGKNPCSASPVTKRHKMSSEACSSSYTGNTASVTVRVQPDNDQAGPSKLDVKPRSRIDSTREIADLKTRIARRKTDHIRDIEDIESEIRRYEEKLTSLRRRKERYNDEYEKDLKYLDSKIQSMVQKQKTETTTRERESKAEGEMRKGIEEKIRLLKEGRKAPSTSFVPNQKDIINTKKMRAAALKKVDERINAIPRPKHGNRTGINVYISAGWTMGALKNTTLPPKPMYMGGENSWCRENTSFDPESLPTYLAHTTQNRVGELIMEELDHRLVSVTEYASAVQRLGLRIERLGLETVHQLMDDEKAIANIRWRNDFEEKKLHLRKGTVMFYIKNRAAEFHRAAEKHAKLMLDILDASDPDIFEIMSGELHGLLDRLWWFVKLNDEVSKNTNF